MRLGWAALLEQAVAEPLGWAGQPGWVVPQAPVLPPELVAQRAREPPELALLQEYRKKPGPGRGCRTGC